MTWGYGDGRGNGSACGATSCPAPAPTGACCVRTASGTTCSVVNARQCYALHGRWRGPTTDCEHGCDQSPNCDWNDDGSVNVDDVIAFLEDYRTGNADFNGDGVTNPTDLMLMVDCIR